MGKDAEEDKATRVPRAEDGAFGVLGDRTFAEAALRDEARTLDLLHEVGTALASARDLPALLQIATDAATRLSGAQYGAYLANNTATPEPRLVTKTSVGGPPRLGQALERGLALRLFETIRRTRAPTRCHLGAAESNVGSDVGSCLAVPVVARGDTSIGGLYLLHCARDAFDERTQRIVSIVATQCAIAIENSALHESLQRDTAERARLLDAERSARTHAERMSEIKDEFLATLSHELRTPLNAILGWAQVLQAGPRRAANLERGLEAIERNARMQTQLIEDLLDMSRITSGKLRLQVRPLMPVGFVEAALETVQPAAEAKSIRIDRMLDTAAGPVYGDPSRLQQVIWNLLSNAIKFTPQGGRVRVLLENGATHVSIMVSDTGIGIRPEFLPQVFDRFRQADASTTRSYQGLGLGLAIVKHVIELHGGRVSVHSRGEGSGARFVVQLPLVVRAEGDAAVAPSVPTERPRGAMRDSRAYDLSGVKVLMVDDAPDACELVSRTLGDCGACVLTADSARAALALIESERPDVLLSDIGMPEVDGLALLEAVRALGPARGGAVPAIAVTAYVQNEDRSRTAAAGFKMHVAKPVEPAVLAAAVATILGRAG